MKTYSHDFEVADMGLLEWGRNEDRKSTRLNSSPL